MGRSEVEKQERDRAGRGGFNGDRAAETDGVAAADAGKSESAPCEVLLFLLAALRSGSAPDACMALWSECGATSRLLSGRWNAASCSAVPKDFEVAAGDLRARSPAR